MLYEVITESYYVSIDEYVNHLIKKQYESELIVVDKKNVKQVLLEYPYNCIYYGVYDPQFHAEAIIKQVQISTKISDYQILKLKDMLTSLIQDNEFGKKALKDLPFPEQCLLDIYYRNLVDVTLQKVLLFDQYWRYKSNEDILKDRNSIALNMLYEVIGEPLTKYNIFSAD